MLDGFDNDDGVIHHQADGEHETEERERVHRETEHREQREGADQRNRDREQRNERRSPPLQEDEDDEDDQQQRLDQGVLDFLHALRDGERGIQGNDVIEIGREFLLQLRHRLLRTVGRGDGVRTGQLV